MHFEGYQDYCEGIGVVADSKVLTQAMQKLSPKVRDGWVHKPKKERVWLGFTVKNREQQSSLEQMPQMEQQNILGKYFENDNLKIRENKTGVPSVASVLTVSTGSSSETELALDEKKGTDKIPVPAVPLSHDSSISECSEEGNGYSQLVCVFCGKDAGDHFVQDDFTWNKPAHKSCYEAKRSELANLDNSGDA
jgi:hypothetical protein